MNQRQRNIKLPLIVSASCLVFVTLLITLTDPIKNIIWAVFFFLALFILLISLATLFITAQKGGVSVKARHRVFLIASFIVLSLMLRSAGSLSLVDALTLVLILVGMAFYFSKRKV
jgi:hypothetical protein